MIDPLLFNSKNFFPPNKIQAKRKNRKKLYFFPLLVFLLFLTFGFSQTTNIVSGGSATSPYVTEDNKGGVFDPFIWQIPLTQTNCGGRGIIDFNFAINNQFGVLIPGGGGRISYAMHLSLYVNNTLIWKTSSPDDGDVEVGAANFNVFGGATLLNGPSLPYSMSSLATDLRHNVRIQLPLFTTISSAYIEFDAWEDDAQVRINSLKVTCEECTIKANAGPDKTICDGEDVKLTASGGGTYLWDTGATTASITVSPSPSATKTYTVTVTDGDCEDSDSVKVSVEDTVKIGNYVWVDTDKNGRQNDGNTGVNGVRVRLYECDGTLVDTTTTADDGSGNPGYYEFEVCANSGDYYVMFSGIPSALKFTTTNSGSNDAIDSDANANGRTDCFEITNQDDLTIDAGLVETDCTVTANAGPDKTICGNESVTLTASGGGTYLWNTGETTASITVNPSGTTIYSVTVKNGDCEDSDSVKVSVGAEVKIGDYVWLDTDKDGLQDNGETGINGIKVTLFECDGTQVGTTTTADDGSGDPGFYEFEVCPDSGKYYMVFGDVPNGLDFTTIDAGSNDAIDSDADSNGRTECFEVTDQDDLTIDAGLKNICGVTANAGPDKTICDGESVTLTASGGGTYSWSTGATTASITVSPSGTTVYSVTVKDGDCEDSDSVKVTVADKVKIGNYVWLDTDKDGLQDNGETGINGITVTLFECDGTQVATTTTVDDGSGDPGFYEFEVCANSGDYYVVFSNIPDNYDFTTTNSGSNDAIDSDANANGRTDCFEITDQDDLTIDAGLVGTDCTVTANAGEDVTICGNESVTLTASGGGTYLWNTGETTASITVNPSGTTIYSVTVKNGDCEDSDSVKVSVGAEVKIGDYVWLDTDKDGLQDNGETGINGIKVTLFECDGTQVGTTTTADDGSGDPGFYEFEVCPDSGKYYMVFGDVPNGLDFTTIDAGSNDAIDSDADSNGRTECFEVTDQDDLTIDAGLKNICGVTANAGPDKTICDGESVTLTASGGGTYSWSTGATTASITVSPSGTTVYSVTVKDGDCEDSDSVKVTVADKVKIGNYVWLDTDKDGLQDNGETGINGITVTLFECDGTQVATTTTVDDGSGDPGFYEFEVCANSGDYYVMFSGIPNDYEFTTTNQGSNDAIDSDANANGRTDCFEITDQDDLTIDAGLVGTDCTIEANAGEDVTICGNEEVTLTASGGGTYSWSTGATTASITVSPSTTTVYSVTVKDGDCEDSDSVKVTVADKVKIGNYVWLDTDKDGLQDNGETGINGIRVTLFECDGTQVDTTTTADDGSGDPGFYEFEVCANSGDYYVVFGDIPSTLKFTTIDAGSNDAIDSDANANGRTDCFEITDQDDLTIDAGLVAKDCDAMANAGDDVTICGNESVTLTASGGGTYSWSTGATTASITVSPSATTIYSVTVKNGDCEDSDSVKVSVGAEVKIGDYVWLDTDKDGLQDNGETGINGIKVTLFDCDGTQVDTTTTADDGSGDPGFYEFEVCPDSGKYYIVFGDVPNGLDFTTIDAGSNDAMDSDADSNGRTDCFEITDQDDLTIDAGLKNICGVTANAGDDVTICEGESVTLTASGGGTYSWSTGATTASITVSPSTTTIYSVTVKDGDCEDSDSVKVTVEDKVKIGDYVWDDTNSNGLQDNGETGVGDVTVTLFDCDGNQIATTTTTDDGSYEFEVCPNSGDYYVMFGNLPDNYEFTTTNAGSNDAIDSDANANGRTDCFEITDQDDLTIDAGLVGTDCTIEANAGDDVTICEGESVTLTASGGGTYSWSTGATTASITVSPSTTTIYSVTVKDGDCEDSDSVKVTVEDKVKIGDYVWDDTNSNGLQDNGETGVGDVTVTLFDCDGNQIATTTTTDDGSYEFEVCPNSGDYYVMFGNLPDNYEFTTTNAGSNDAIDSDANANGRTDCFEITDQDDLTIDAGLVGTDCTIEANAGDDVTICEGESVTLTASGGGTYSWSTGATTASITVSPSTTTIYSVTVKDGDCEDSDSVKVTVEDKVKIGDYVWDDTNSNGLQDNGETGVGDVTVTLFDCDGNQIATTTTADDGSYEFEVCPNSGDYYVMFGNLPDNYEFTTTNAGSNDAIDSDANANGRTDCFEITDQDDLTIDAGLSKKCDVTANAGDDVTICEGESVTLTASGGGTYSWSTGATTASITVSPSTTTTYSVTVKDGDCEDSDSVKVTVEDKVKIGDYVWDDTNSNGLQDNGETGVGDVTVTLFDCDGNQIATTTTADDGSYEFEVCPNSGDYYVMFGNLPDNYEFTTTNQGSNDAIDSDANANGRTDCFEITDQDDLTIDAGLSKKCDVTANAGDDVTICEGESVTLTASGGGTYSWSTGATTASITVSPSTTTTYSVTVKDGDCEDSDSVKVTVEDKVKIGDYVWDDTNSNGLQDNGETGVGDVTITLFDCDGNQIATTTTADDGSYEFEVCPNSGDYYVMFGNLPDNYEFTTTNQGSNDAIDSDANANGRTDCFEITDQDDLTIDAGLSKKCDVTANAGEDVTICEGESVTLTASGGGTYSWSTGATTASITVSPSTTTTYSVTVKDGDCEDSDYVKVTVADTVKVGDYVWNDTNSNGLQNKGEKGVNGVTVTLFDCDGNQIATTTTADNGSGVPGFYQFEVCANSGDYYVMFGDIPDNYEFTTTNQGSNDAIDSDANANGRTDCFEVTDQDILTIDAGLIEKCDFTANAGDDKTICTEHGSSEEIELTASVIDNSGACPGGCVYDILERERCSGTTRAYDIWLRSTGVKTSFLFVASEQKFQILANGNAKYTATASNGVDTIKVDVTFAGYTKTAPADSTNENRCQEYDTSDWQYWTTTTGTITSENHGVFNITRAGEAFQLGNGADITRLGFGASGWFDVSGGDGHYVTGDFTLALGECKENGVEYKWTTQDGNIVGNANQKIITVDKAGTYIVEAKNCADCIDISTVVVREDCSTKKGGSRTTKMMSVHPNPVQSGSVLNIEFDSTGGSLESSKFVGSKSFSKEQISKEDVNIMVFDMTGRLISIPRTFELVKGKAIVHLDIENIPSGQYIVKAQGATWSDSKNFLVR